MQSNILDIIYNIFCFVVTCFLMVVGFVFLIVVITALTTFATVFLIASKFIGTVNNESRTK